MLTIQLLKRIKGFVGFFGDDNYALQKMSELSHAYTELSPSFVGITINLGNPTDVHTRIQGIVNNINSRLLKIKSGITPSELINGLRDAIDRVAEFTKDLPIGPLNIAEHLVDFTKAYDSYIDNQTTDKALLLLVQAHRTYAAVTTFINTLLVFSRALDTQSEQIVEGRQITEIMIYSDFGLEMVCKKILAIDEIYREMCKMSGTNPAEEPLQIVRMEAGSLFLTVMGAVLPMKLMQAVIIKGGDILFSRYIREGKIAAQLEYLDDIKKVVELKKLLEENGIDTTNIGERIRMTSELCADKLFQLMINTPFVEVNGKAIGVDQFMRQLQGTAITPLQLGQAQKNDS